MLIGRGRQVEALHAVLINCLASSIYSFDDTHGQAAVDPGIAHLEARCTAPSARR
jgi:2-methylcitrate dehydratase PrpD